MSDRASKGYEIAAAVIFIGLLADFLAPSVSAWYWTRKMKRAEAAGREVPGE